MYVIWTDAVRKGIHELEKDYNKTEDDIKASQHIRSLIPVYYQWKYAADQVLIKRDAFEWTILRPGLLNDKPGTGKATIGRTHLLPEITVRYSFSGQATMLTIACRETTSHLPCGTSSSALPLQGSLST